MMSDEEYTTRHQSMAIARETAHAVVQELAPIIADKAIAKACEDKRKAIAELDKRVAVMETELVHGSSIFRDIKQDMADIKDAVAEVADDLREHMLFEEGMRNKVSAFLIVGLLGIVGALVAYIWQGHV